MTKCTRLWLLKQRDIILCVFGNDVLEWGIGFPHTYCGRLKKYLAQGEFVFQAYELIWHFLNKFFTPSEINNGWSYKNGLQNGVTLVNSLSKLVFKNPGFLSKSFKFLYILDHTIWSISQVCGPNTYQIMHGETLKFRCQHLQR